MTRIGRLVRKGFVDVPHGQMHYRVAGDGPPVILLHDSPRSSAMHVAMLEWLADEFTAISIDTPGNGHSTPLAPGRRPEIPDFAAALAACIAALGIERCPVYGFHTSSKIALHTAAAHPERIASLVLDGLSLPATPATEDYLARYLSPFEVNADGSYLATAWTKVRDMQRYFPWFATAGAARLPIPFPDPERLHVIALDYFTSGAAYSGAYGAAIRYDAKPALRRVTTPTHIVARKTDVLYAYLDALPPDLPPSFTVQRDLTGDAEQWRQRVRELLRLGIARGAGAARLPDPLASAATGREVRGYVTLGHGQLHVRRFGTGTGRPLLALHELPGSAAGLREIAGRLGADRIVYAPDLPGLGESDPLPVADVGACCDALLGAMDACGVRELDVLAEHTTSAVAVELARRAPARVRRVVLDGIVLADAAARESLASRYCPAIAPTRDGSHFWSTWHRLRDQRITWPWYSDDAGAARRSDPDLDAQRLHETMVDVLRQPAMHGDLCRAALRHDVAAALPGVAQPVLLASDAQDVRYADAGRAASLLRAAVSAERPTAAAARAEAWRAFLDGAQG